MKPLSYSLIAAALACGFANAQTTAYTDPVGYVTSYIGPNAGNNAEEGAATFISAPLITPTTYAGAATTAPTAGGHDIMLGAGVPAGLDTTYYLEIADGTSEGWFSACTASVAGTSITVFDPLPAGLSNGVKVTVRKFTTIRDIFGDNAPGLSGSDDILVLTFPEVVPQEPVRLVWAAGDWYDGFENPSGGLIVYPGTAVKVRHFADTTLSVVQEGQVKLTKTQVDLFPYDNWLGQPLAAGGTLGSMQFGTQILPGPLDILQIFQTATVLGQEAIPYIRFGNDMYDGFENLATDVPIAAGGGYLIARDPGESSSTITIPAQVVAP